MDDPTFRRHLQATLDDYERRFPVEAGALAPIRAQLGSPGDPRDRTTLPGHVTASALIVDDNPAGHGPRLLLVRHVGLGMWLQPGGHVDPGEVPDAAALREAREETGLTVELIAREPIDVDVHAIPANAARGVPAHLHYDFRYLTRVCGAGAAAIELATGEVSDVRWLDLADVAAADATDLARAIAKVRAAVRA